MQLINLATLAILGFAAALPADTTAPAGYTTKETTTKKTTSSTKDASTPYTSTTCTKSTGY
ncbi:hypothetical protein KC336_g19390, partial [Hortaea werneckii]